MFGLDSFMFRGMCDKMSFEQVYNRIQVIVRQCFCCDWVWLNMILVLILCGSIFSVLLLYVDVLCHTLPIQKSVDIWFDLSWSYRCCQCITNYSTKSISADIFITDFNICSSVCHRSWTDLRSKWKKQTAPIKDPVLVGPYHGKEYKQKSCDNCHCKMKDMPTNGETAASINSQHSSVESGVEITATSSQPNHEGHEVPEKRPTPYERLSHDLSNDNKCMKEITLGKRIGFYRIRGELGTGNFSQVKMGIHALTKGEYTMPLWLQMDLHEPNFIIKVSNVSLN